MTESLTLFEDDSATPDLRLIQRCSLAEVEGHPLLREDAWIALRDSGIPPLVEARMVTTPQSRAEFLHGAHALGLIGRAKELQPQQLQAADVLNSDAFTVAVLMPRRSSKTTSLICALLGRCFLRDDYQVAFTLATTGAKARERFKLDVAAVLERVFPDPESRPFKIHRAAAFERVEFKNGSVFAVATPNGESFRSSAYDAVLIDESAEADPDLGEDLTSAILPTMDTRPDGQLILAGTAGTYRRGNLLWDALEDPDAAVLRFAFPDTTTDEELAEWTPTEAHPEGRVRDLIRATHPGLAGLTSEAAIERNYRKLGPERFSREYGGLFGMTGIGTGLFDIARWHALATEAEFTELPDHFSMAITVHPDQSFAAIGAAWRDEEGRACVRILDYRPGVQWLSKAAVDLSRRYRVPIIHDSMGMVSVEVQAISRARPLPRLLPQNTRNIVTSAGLFSKELGNGNVLHWGQEELDEAVRVATKRKIGQGNAWAFGRAQPIDMIAPLEACAMALRVYDETPSPTPRRKVFVAT